MFDRLFQIDIYCFRDSFIAIELSRFKVIVAVDNDHALSGGRRSCQTNLN